MDSNDPKCKNNPIIHVENITPSHVMEGWILEQANLVNDTETIVVCWIWQKIDSCVPLVWGAQWERPNAGFPR
jgi:hypothetical protein